MKTSGGATLIELMLVVSIIMILVSMSLPAMLEARNQAQKVSCRVGLRSYAVSYSRRGHLLIVIPQEANCLECHSPP